MLTLQISSFALNFETSRFFFQSFHYNNTCLYTIYSNEEGIKITHTETTDTIVQQSSNSAL